MKSFPIPVQPLAVQAIPIQRIPIAPPVQRIRETLGAVTGADLWRSLDELAGTADFRDYLEQEFPRLAQSAAAFDRREFLKLMAASFALSGAAGCSRQPEQTILPYVRSPALLTPSQPVYFATAASFGGSAMGLLVQSNLGRPTKVEGNPAHPASGGATDIYAQASVLEAWDPDRSKAFLQDGAASSWEAFASALRNRLAPLAARQGQGLALLTEAVDSPTLGDQILRLKKRLPAARWYQYQPLNQDHAFEGSRLAFGEVLAPRHRFDACRVVVSLDADFLAAPGIHEARAFMAARSSGKGADERLRLYVVEPTPTLTGASADHRLAVRPSQVASLAYDLAQALGLPVKGSGESAGSARGVDRGVERGVENHWIGTCANDLQRARGNSLVIAGASQPAAVHALVRQINDALGNTGSTVSYVTPACVEPAVQMASLRELAGELAGARVDTLLILGGNPAYNAPADLDLAAHLKTVPFSAHLSLYDDETSALCHWHLPQAHYLESWSDTRTFDGTVAVQQPLMAPLYGGRSAHELLALLLGEEGVSDHRAVRDYWRAGHAGADFDAFWNNALQSGVVPGTRFEARKVRAAAKAPLAPPSAAAPGENMVELVFAPDPTVWDGRYANNGWLQELPKPMTKLTWDNAALVSPQLAARLGLRQEDVVELAYRGASVKAPVFILPGQAEGTVTLSLGYGRTRAGRVGSGIGVNAYALRRSDEPGFATGVQISKTGERHALAVTQHHHAMEGRRPVRTVALAHLLEGEQSIRDDAVPEASLYEGVRYEGYAWGMSINLDTCIGCSACTVACQAENNIPIVGKSEVARGREMHWLRIDRYFEGEPANPRTHFQPVPCMHCERAPCEAVCPVEATVHDSEGLNLQVYNRCVGTRFCSNNCPYKVRRFNFLAYADTQEETLKALRNPEVTVRMRGVMEKCTYCVQRITSARIEAEKSERRLVDGEVVTACQAACPTGAIVFGDLNDPQGRARHLKRSPLSYALLAELNTRPRTTYLAKLLNPNPDLDEA